MMVNGTHLEILHIIHVQPICNGKNLKSTQLIKLYTIILFSQSIVHAIKGQMYGHYAKILSCPVPGISLQQTQQGVWLVHMMFVKIRNFISKIHYEWNVFT